MPADSPMLIRLSSAAPTSRTCATSLSTHPETLSFLAWVYVYWIALTDCDGFRIDTVKHVSYEQARNFCGAIKEFAINLGERDFFLVGEIPDDDFASR
jgi:glycosidase